MPPRRQARLLQSAGGPRQCAGGRRGVRARLPLTLLLTARCVCSLSQMLSHTPLPSPTLLPAQQHCRVQPWRPVCHPLPRADRAAGGWRGAAHLTPPLRARPAAVPSPSTAGVVPRTAVFLPPTPPAPLPPALHIILPTLQARSFNPNCTGGGQPPHSHAATPSMNQCRRRCWWCPLPLLPLAGVAAASSPPPAAPSAGAQLPPSPDVSASSSGRRARCRRVSSSPSPSSANSCCLQVQCVARV